MFSVKEKALLSGFLVSILLSFAGFSGKCERISDKVLRFHVVANSDTEEDQTLKLKVRDRILSSCKPIFESAQNLEDAKKNAELNMPLIAKEAEDEIKINGYNYKVDVKVLKMHFNTRHYDTVTLPAGQYYAVRITIGSGNGHNWWCVMFPPMCLPAAQEQTELEDVLNHDEMNVVTGTSTYEFRFKAVEIFEEVRTWFKSIFSILDT